MGFCVKLTMLPPLVLNWPVTEIVTALPLKVPSRRIAGARTAGTGRPRAGRSQPFPQGVLSRAPSGLSEVGV